MGFLQRLLAGKLVVPPVPEGRSVKVTAVEIDVPPKRRTKVSGSSCYIEYTSADGEQTKRTITLRMIEGPPGNPQMLGAHCHVRNRYRNFRLDRIEEMVDCVTGEVLDPFEHCLALQRSGALKVEDKALLHIMRIITFMARCDGDFHAFEQEALDDIIGRYFRFFGGDDAAYECATREAMRLAPSDRDVLSGIRWIKKAPMGKQFASFVLDASKVMIDADGFHRDEEVYWAVELSNELKKIAGR